MSFPCLLTHKTMFDSFYYVIIPLQVDLRQVLLQRATGKIRCLPLFRFPSNGASIIRYVQDTSPEPLSSISYVILWKWHTLSMGNLFVPYISKVCSMVKRLPGTRAAWVRLPTDEPCHRPHRVEITRNFCVDRRRIDKKMTTAVLCVTRNLDLSSLRCSCGRYSVRLNY